MRRLLLPLLALLLGCPGTRDRPSGTPRPPGGSSDAGPSDGGLSDGGGFPDAGGSRAAGLVTVRQDRADQSRSTIGFFVPDDTGDLASFIFPGCTLQTTSGVCKAFTCGGAVLQGISAGPSLTLVGPGGAVEEVPSVANGVYTSSPDPTLFEAGDRITISAPGAEFPGFSGQLTTPSPPMVTLPAGEIDTNTALVVSWSPDPTADEVLLVVASGDQQAVCRTDAGSAGLTVPPQILSFFRGDGTLTFVNQSARVVDASGRSVHLSISELVASSVTFL